MACRARVVPRLSPYIFGLEQALRRRDRPAKVVMSWGELVRNGARVVIDCGAVYWNTKS